MCEVKIKNKQTVCSIGIIGRTQIVAHYSQHNINDDKIGGIMTLAGEWGYRKQLIRQSKWGKPLVYQLREFVVGTGNAQTAVHDTMYVQEHRACTPLLTKQIITNNDIKQPASSLYFLFTKDKKIKFNGQNARNQLVMSCSMHIPQHRKREPEE